MTPREAWEERKRLSAEALRLQRASEKRFMEAYSVFARAIAAEHGNIEIKWLPNGGCEVNGEVFEP